MIRDVLHSLGNGGWDEDALESYKPLLEHYTIGVFSRLKSYMIDWARSLNRLSLFEKYPDIRPDSLLISFNYTNTLERHFHIHSKRINYIHGSAQEESCDLILGHDMDESNMDYDVDDNQEGQGRVVVRSFFKYGRKPVERIIKENQRFWEKLSSVAEIIFVDIRYLRSIFLISKPLPHT